MSDEVRESFNDVLSLWQKMKTSSMDEAGDDADRFQTAFYNFTDRLATWVHTLDKVPDDVEEARSDEDFQPFFEQMPEPLKIPFEMELEAILDGRKRQIDSTEQS